jgi:DNA-binding XRE family transcriptional regulator
MSTTDTGDPARELLARGLERRDGCERAWRKLHAKIGGHMRVAREAAGATQAGVADAMGVSTQFVSMLELGGRDWTRRLIDSYRSALEG